MIGDLILKLRSWLKQCFCIHDYRAIRTFDKTWYRCSKCGRIVYTLP